jgi:hypothetical protein
MSLNGFTGNIGETGPPKPKMEYLLPVFESGKRIVLYIFYDTSFSWGNGCYADLGSKDPELFCGVLFDGSTPVDLNRESLSRAHTSSKPYLDISAVPLVDLPVIEINYPQVKDFPAALAYVKWRLENGK